MRLRTTLALLALSAATFAAVPARAQLQELGSIARMILLLPEEEKPPIDYRERPPLVVPPNRTLRTPSPTSNPQERRANWPVDPEIEGRRRAAEEARRPRNFDSVFGRDDQAGVRRMTPNEIAAGRIRGAGVPQRGEITAPYNDPWKPTADNALAGVVALPQIRNPEQEGSDILMPGVEPRRRFLTEPPVGTRMPAGNQPVRATRDQDFRPRQDPSPYDIFRETPRTR